MKKFLAAAATLLLIGAGCGAQTSGSVDLQVPSGSVNVEGGGSSEGGGSGSVEGGYQY